MLFDTFELAIALATEPFGLDERPVWLRQTASSADSDQWRYYRYFYELTNRLPDPRIVEVGTDKATGSAHLAAAHEGQVDTIDIDSACQERVERLHLPNLHFRLGRGVDLAGSYPDECLDLVFFDGLHTFENTYREYIAYRRALRPGGLMFFDDVGLDAEMEKLWNAIEDPKMRLDHLHFTGFGIAMKHRAATTDRLARHL